ncbi:MAG TPA: helix-turn-helix transcriptional regulator [Candidatus Goldiibacteriota bacterium]|nr:helix-turn-helix transcriptional regulator [Candidatus Goldiibacteriota bacterium]
MIKDNILTTKSDIYGFMPGEISKDISKRARERRLELNLSQAALAKRSGVSLGTLKRFERIAEISLKNLLLLAAAMDALDGFKGVFSGRNYATFEEAVESGPYRKRKRGRINE